MLALAGSAGSALAQTDVLYSASYPYNRVESFQYGSLVNGTSQMYTGGSESGIAVAGDVRTLGVGSTGGQYTLGLTSTSTPYTYPGGLPGNPYDGTTDGKYNYGALYGTTSVYRFDRDWQNPSLLFNTSSNVFGITYDTSNNTLWVADPFSGVVTNYNMSGGTISSFSSGISFGGLAYEPSTDTLWETFGGSSQIRQFNKSGGYIQDVTMSGGSPMYYGIEFDTGGIPAPGSLALLGLGGLGAARRRR